MPRNHAQIACALAACLIASPAMLRAADKPEKKAVAVDTKKAETDAKKSDDEAKKPGKGESLKKAIQELNKEAHDFAKNPNEAKLRTVSDYFKSVPDDVTVDQLIGAIERSQAPEPFVDAYIRWQLMSGLPAELDAKQLRRLYNAYQNTPRLQNRFGVDPRDRQWFDSMIRGGKETDEETAKAKLNELRRPTSAPNGAIIHLRSALIARFPRNYDSILLSLNEAQMRLDHGINVTEFLKNVADTIHLWIVMDNPPPAQMESLVAMLNKTKDYKGATVIKSVKWDEKDNALKTEIGAETFGDKTFDESIKELKEAVQNPGANELKFKDDDKSSKDKKKR